MQCPGAKEEAWEVLTAMRVQVHLQSSGIGEALGALREGTQAGNLRGTVFVFFRHRSSVPLPPAAIVHQMGLQIPLAPIPDATGLAREYILCGRKHKDISAAAHLGVKQHVVQFVSETALRF